jgi:hypothetical protein
MYFANSIPEPIVKIQTPQNKTLSLSNGKYKNSSPFSFLNAVVPGS